MATAPNPNQVWLARAEELRDEAWAALTREPTFAALKAFDDAVVAVGGKTLLPPFKPRVSMMDMVKDAIVQTSQYVDRARRVSQGDAAAAILQELGEPTTGANILSLLPEKGVTVGGEKPIVNFTSTLSKDARFHSVRVGGTYYWWFKEQALPAGWSKPDQASFDDEVDLGGDDDLGVETVSEDDDL